MTENGLAVMNPQMAAIEKVLINGDLSDLSPEQRVIYYREVCQSLGLNPYTKPFEYLRLSGKLTLYATRNATDQLRSNHHASTQVVSRERMDEVYVVTARATAPDGRFDESIGAVSIVGLKGDNLANALMKAETKAKRRATLALFGLSFMDETEIETVPVAEPRVVDVATGEIAVSEPDPGQQWVEAAKERLAPSLEMWRAQDAEEARAVQTAEVEDVNADIAPACECGPRVWRTGVKNGKEWRAWMCPSRPGKCPPQWVD